MVVPVLRTISLLKSLLRCVRLSGGIRVVMVVPVVAAIIVMNKSRCACLPRRADNSEVEGLYTNTMCTSATLLVITRISSENASPREHRDCARLEDHTQLQYRDFPTVHGGRVPVLFTVRK